MKYEKWYRSDSICVFSYAAIVSAALFASCSGCRDRSGSAGGQSRGSTTSQVAGSAAQFTVDDESSTGSDFKVGVYRISIDPSGFCDRLTDWRGDQQAPIHRFLVLKVRVKNDGKSPASVPEFGLIDDDGATYMRSDLLLKSELKSSLATSNLNPHDVREGLVVFDVEGSRQYTLTIRVSYTSRPIPLVHLVPGDCNF